MILYWFNLVGLVVIVLILSHLIGRDQHDAERDARAQW